MGRQKIIDNIQDSAKKNPEHLLEETAEGYADSVMYFLSEINSALYIQIIYHINDCSKKF